MLARRRPLVRVLLVSILLPATCQQDGEDDQCGMYDHTVGQPKPRVAAPAWKEHRSAGTTRLPHRLIGQPAGVGPGKQRSDGQRELPSLGFPRHQRDGTKRAT
jgi:hypothetical protein